jgi:hypothetical protein
LVHVAIQNTILLLSRGFTLLPVLRIIGVRQNNRKPQV